MGGLTNKMETTIVYWGNIGIMEKKMETTIMGFIGYITKQTTMQLQHHVVIL